MDGRRPETTEIGALTGQIRRFRSEFGNRAVLADPQRGSARAQLTGYRLFLGLLVLMESDQEHEEEHQRDE